MHQHIGLKAVPYLRCPPVGFILMCWADLRVDGGCAGDHQQRAAGHLCTEPARENVLTVVNISSYATPCVRVFPAVLALAKNFVGYAAFGRLLYESSDETQALANQLKVREVWTTLSALPMVCVTPSSVHQTKHCDCRQGSCAGQAHVWCNTLLQCTEFADSHVDRTTPCLGSHYLHGWMGGVM